MDKPKPRRGGRNNTQTSQKNQISKWTRGR